MEFWISPQQDIFLYLATWPAFGSAPSAFFSLHPLENAGPLKYSLVLFFSEGGLIFLVRSWSATSVIFMSGFHSRAWGKHSFIDLFSFSQAGFFVGFIAGNASNCCSRDRNLKFSVFGKKKSSRFSALLPAYHTISNKKLSGISSMFVKKHKPDTPIRHAPSRYMGEKLPGLQQKMFSHEHEVVHPVGFYTDNFLISEHPVRSIQVGCPPSGRDSVFV